MTHRRRCGPASASRRSSCRSATARPGATSAGSSTAARQLRDVLLAFGPLAVNHRGPAPAARRLDRRRARAARRRGRRDRPRRRSLSPGPSAASPRHLRAGRTTGVLKLVGIPLVGLARDPQLSRRAARRPRRERAQPARHAAGPRAEGLLAGARSARRAAPARRHPRSLRSSRDGDARGLGVERAGRPARLEFRGAVHGARQVAGDRSAGRPQPPRRAHLARRAIERTPVLRDARPPRAAGVSADEVRLRHRRRRLVARQGHHRRVARPAAEGARPEGRRPEVRPVPERRPGHDEPVPARRGVRHRGRRRDRPRHRPLRALPRPEPLAEREPHPGRRSGTACSARSARATTSARPSR